MITHESLNQWNFVIAAYAIGLGGTALLLVRSWISMRKAEKRREKGREK